jgi:hypothetical protein
MGRVCGQKGRNGMADGGQRFILHPDSHALFRMDTDTGETWQMKWDNSTATATWIYVPEPTDSGQKPVPQRENKAFHDAIDKQFGS